MKNLKLTKKIVLKNIKELVDLDQVVETNERWGHDHFLMELAGKWDNSFAVFDGEKIIGFIVCSIKIMDTLHIHRLAVKKEYQKMGVGTQLIGQVIDRLEKECSNISFITLKVGKINYYAQKFYEKNGFRRLSIENTNYIYRRML